MFHQSYQALDHYTRIKFSPTGVQFTCLAREFMRKPDDTDERPPKVRRRNYLGATPPAMAPKWNSDIESRLYFHLRDSIAPQEIQQVVMQQQLQIEELQNKLKAQHSIAPR